MREILMPFRAGASFQHNLRDRGATGNQTRWIAIPGYARRDAPALSLLQVLMLDITSSFLKNSGNERPR